MSKKMKWIVPLVVLLLIGVSWLIARPWKIHGDCMEPAIKGGKRYYANQLAPYLSNFKVGDIVTFNHEGKPWIARIVALPNDSILIKHHEIIVNNQPSKPIARNWEGWNYGTYAINNTLKVPSDSVYVLSDNLSAQHDDSRVFGPIRMTSISGRIW